MWSLWLFGAASLPLGLYLWNGLGPHFGLGTAAGKVDHRAAYVFLRPAAPNADLGSGLEFQVILSLRLWGIA